MRKRKPREITVRGGNRYRWIKGASEDRLEVRTKYDSSWAESPADIGAFGADQLHALADLKDDPYVKPVTRQRVIPAPGRGSSCFFRVNDKGGLEFTACGVRSGWIDYTSYLIENPNPAVLRAYADLLENPTEEVEVDA